MYKAVFRIDGDSPYSKSTSGTDTEIKLWCNDHCDLLYVTGERQDDVISHVRSEVGVDEQLEDHNGQFVITEDCLAEQAGDYIRPYLVANNCLLFPPWQYENGTKVVRVLALDPANLSSFYRDISSEYSVIVESKRKLTKVESETPMLSVRSQFPTLTDRQREAFLTAYERGITRSRAIRRRPRSRTRSGSADERLKTILDAPRRSSLTCLLPVSDPPLARSGTRYGQRDVCKQFVDLIVKMRFVQSSPVAETGPSPAGAASVDSTESL